MKTLPKPFFLNQLSFDSKLGFLKFGSSDYIFVCSSFCVLLKNYAQLIQASQSGRHILTKDQSASIYRMFDTYAL